jgi:hypothetical protein
MLVATRVMLPTIHTRNSSYNMRRMPPKEIVPNASILASKRQESALPLHTELLRVTFHRGSSSSQNQIGVRRIDVCERGLLSVGHVSMVHVLADERDVVQQE